MAGADEGADRRPRQAPFQAESAESTDRPSGTGFFNAVTQLLPLVNREPAVVDVPVVRAVARRAAAALPSLGGDEPTLGIPASVRDRALAAGRRRASGRTTEPPAATPGDAAEDAGHPRAVVHHVDSDGFGTVYGTPAAPVGPAEEPDPPSPSVELPSRSVEPTPSPVRAGSTPSVRAEPTSPVPADPGPADPGPVAADPAPPVPDEPAPSADAAMPGAAEPEPDPSLAADPAAPPRGPKHARSPYVTIVAPATEAPAALSAVDRAAVSDAWSSLPTSEVPVLSDATASDPVVGAPVLDPAARTDEWTEAPPALPADDDARPGPAPLDADSWDATLGGGELEAYQGRRRAQLSSARLWLLLALIVLGLVAAIGIPLTLTSANSDPQPALQPPPVTEEEPTGGGGPTGELISPASSPGPSPTKVSPRSTGVPSPKPATSTAVGLVPPFAPLTLEAEDAALSGTVSIDRNPQCSPGGPPVVSRVGKWDSGAAGVVTFTATVPTAGAYAMTVWYVLTNDTSRTAEISVNGAIQNVTFLNSERTGSPAGCVDPQPVITVTLVAGANTIRFANPSNHAPTLDRIVISKP